MKSPVSVLTDVKTACVSSWWCCMSVVNWICWWVCHTETETSWWKERWVCVVLHGVKSTGVVI